MNLYTTFIKNSGRKPARAGIRASTRSSKPGAVANGGRSAEYKRLQLGRARLSPHTVYKAAEAGKLTAIPHRSLKRVVLFDPAELDEWTPATNGGYRGRRSKPPQPDTVTETEPE